MLFNSLAFAFFLPIVFMLYWSFSKSKLKIQNLLLLAASYVFYGWWDWRFLSLIMVSTIVDYFVGLIISQSDIKLQRKVFLIISIVFNLGLLGFFKYFNFFISSWVELLTSIGYQVQGTSTLNIILPVGISFYTFQTMSYTIDVYRKKLIPTKDFISFAAFVSFFPQLVAGPIERASHLLPQILKRRKFDTKVAIVGVHLIVWGMFKKVAVADNLAMIVDSYYGNIELYSGNTIYTIIVLIFYSFQIYCDFSGYSDIAIGTSKLFGISLSENFRRPYFSSSFSEFWQRWHISLSSWLKDYLYIPLGGNRKGKLNTYKNNMLTMLLGGLWHGASFNFIIWGGLQGVFLIIQRVIGKNKILLNRVVIFILITMAWIPFRALTLSDTVMVFKSLASFNFSMNFPVGLFKLVLALVMVLLLLSIDILEELKIRTKNWYISTFLLLLLLLFGNWHSNSFIYFQF
ncbi:MBOAT family protein [Flavobacteriaceae bacterium]|nr:MBOAT family protein [Flavobacteriaceae bacterium]